MISQEAPTREVFLHLFVVDTLWPSVTQEEQDFLMHFLQIIATTLNDLTGGSIILYCLFCQTFNCCFFKAHILNSGDITSKRAKISSYRLKMSYFFEHKHGYMYST